MEERLLEDVNLSEIRFAEDGGSLILSFLNMSDGAEVGILVCSGLAFVAYSNDPDGTLPGYAGEVNRTRVSNVNEASTLLRRLGYGYRDFSGMRLVDEASGLWHVHVEGDFTLEVVCREAELEK